jgi:hypothetical protein
MRREDLIIKKDFAEIRELGRNEQENCIRVFCTMFPDGFEFQIRTFKPTDEYQKGIKRQMIASVGLSIEELKKILAYMEAEKESK